jgi:hypothetical protein
MIALAIDTPRMGRQTGVDLSTRQPTIDQEEP